LRGRIVAEHARVWARGTTRTDPAHVETAARLRKQFQQPRAVGTVLGAADDLTRDLAEYDRAFGLVPDQPNGLDRDLAGDLARDGEVS